MKIFKARALMALNPGFLMAGNVATRLDVPIESENGVSLGQLFFFNNTLSRHILLLIPSGKGNAGKRVVYH